MERIGREIPETESSWWFRQDSQSIDHNFLDLFVNFTALDILFYLFWRIKLSSDYSDETAT